MKTKKAALTLGIVWGATMFLTTLLAVWFGYGIAMLKVVQSIYPGYQISLAGSLVGAIYGFFDMFVGVYIVSWVYHNVAKLK